MSEGIAILTTNVNGRDVQKAVSPRMSAADFVRHELGLTGTHIGCEHGVCGACTIVVDGYVARGCLLFAVQLDGCKVETIEGATQSGRVADLQAAFVKRNALQCGFCTPGMISDRCGGNRPKRMYVAATRSGRPCPAICAAAQAMRRSLTRSKHA